MWRHHMLEAVSPLLWHFLKGVYNVVPPDMLAVFDSEELELLLCGVPNIDVEDWARHCEYAGEYRRSGGSHRVIKWFWEVAAALSPADRGKLLQFSTGSPRVPAQGFKALQRNDGRYQRFCIQSVPRNELRYPRSHTCFNRIDLPVYASKNELESAIRLVLIGDMEGFSVD